MVTRSAQKKTPAAPAKKAAVKAPTRKTAVKAAVKPAAKTAAKPAAKPAVKPAVKSSPAAEKQKKPKLVRDSFTMPEAEYASLVAVKKACIKNGFEVKKSELLRIGVALIGKMDLAQLKNILATLPPLKAGRPKKNK
ncbi:MAG: hypothetical protein JSS58_05350 [Proteobacteria bacterium]|nr:hypothetical protein [Pseudomonadota bacterium]